MNETPEKDVQMNLDIFTRAEFEIIEKGLAEIAQIRNDLSATKGRLENLEFKLKTHVEAVKEHLRRKEE
jgi:BMFP domain-containing protein YqiC